LTFELAGGEIFAAGRSKLAFVRAPPVTEINHVHDSTTFGRVQDGFLDVLGGAQGDRGAGRHTAAAPFCFPRRNRIQPKLHEVERTGEFGAGELNHVDVVREVIKALADVAFVQLATPGMCCVIK
jgi:hypothetical protein